MKTAGVYELLGQPSYIEISIFSYTILFPPVLHNFL